MDTFTAVNRSDPSDKGKKGYSFIPQLKREIGELHTLTKAAANVKKYLLKDVLFAKEYKINILLRV